MAHPFAAETRRLPTYNVKDFGCKGDGKTLDLAGIRVAINAARAGGGVVLFPSGQYWLGEIGAATLIHLSGVRNVRLVGESAELRCKTTSGTSNVFRLSEVSNVEISGFAFTDDGLDRDVNWKGAVAVEMSAEARLGCQNIRIADCHFTHVLTAVAASGTVGAVRKLHLEGLRIQSCYYGLSFQEAGDDVRARNISVSDTKRSYFPYGVDHHDVDLTTDSNATGFTDILIKSYTKPTSNLTVRVACSKKVRGDCIVAFDQQHEEDRGKIRNIDVTLSAREIDCSVRSAFLFRAFTKEGAVKRTTASEWTDIRLDGKFDLCERTSLLRVDSIPQRTATVSLGPGCSELAIPDARNFAFVRARRHRE